MKTEMRSCTESKGVYTQILAVLYASLPGCPSSHTCSGSCEDHLRMALTAHTVRSLAVSGMCFASMSGLRACGTCGYGPDTPGLVPYGPVFDWPAGFTSMMSLIPAVSTGEGAAV